LQSVPQRASREDLVRPSTRRYNMTLQAYIQCDVKRTEAREEEKSDHQTSEETRANRDVSYYSK